MTSSLAARAGRSGAGRALSASEGVVGVLVGLASGGVEDDLDLLEAGEGSVPPVIPAKAGIHEHGRIRFANHRVHGFRVKPGMTGRGMTNERRGADSA
jgi:hypothetical protein